MVVSRARLQCFLCRSGWQAEEHPGRGELGGRCAALAHSRSMSRPESPASDGSGYSLTPSKREALRASNFLKDIGHLNELSAQGHRRRSQEGGHARAAGDMFSPDRQQPAEVSGEKKTGTTARAFPAARRYHGRFASEAPPCDRRACGNLVLSRPGRRVALQRRTISLPRQQSRPRRAGPAANTR